MALPEVEEQLFWHEITVMEKEEKMRYMTTGERIGFKRGVQQGMQQGVQQGGTAGCSTGKGYVVKPTDGKAVSSIA